MTNNSVFFVKKPFWDNEYKISNKTLCEGVFYLDDTERQKSIYLKLSPFILFMNKEKQSSSANITNCIISLLEHKKGGQFIRIVKNNEKLDVFGNVAELFENLKPFCVQNHFSLKYTINSVIADGITSNVLLATNYENNQKFAIKCFMKQGLMKNTYKQSLIREIEILRKLSHPSILSLHELFEDEENVYLIQPYLAGGDLYNYVENNRRNEKKIIKEEIIVEVIFKILEAIKYIHSQGIIHRDIKLENIIIENESNPNTLKIADFGLADYFRIDGKYIYPRCGTPGYVAPEILLGKPYEYKVDVYSIGILFFILLTNKHPFYKQNKDNLLQQLKQINFHNVQCSQQTLNLLKNMLEFNPLKRYSVQQCLAHPCFRKFTGKPSLHIEIPRGFHSKNQLSLKSPLTCRLERQIASPREKSSEMNSYRIRKGPFLQQKYKFSMAEQ